MSQIQLYQGDCLEIMPTLPEKSVQMVFADLPYKTKKYHSTDCAWDVNFGLSYFWATLNKLLCPATACVMTAAQPFTTDLIISNKNHFKYCLVWDKVNPGNFMQAKKMPMKNHEDIVVFYKKQPTYNPIMIEREKPRVFKQVRAQGSLSAGGKYLQPGYVKTYTHRFPRSIITAGTRSDRARGLHPTQKPVALLEYLIRTYTNEGDTILDPTAGSMTTAIAALRTGRRAICIEKDPTYFKLGSKRVADEQQALGAA